MNEKQMLLVTTSWSSENKNQKVYDTIRMIPITNDCPYIECFYDPLTKVMVLLGKDQKDNFTLLQKLDEFGHGRIKNNKALVDRHRAPAYKEYYIYNKEEIKSFITLFGFNADTFNYAKYLDGLVESVIDGNILQNTDPIENLETSDVSKEVNLN